VLYTASYFEPQRHHGKLISISRSIPQNFRVHGRLEFFIPSTDLLRDWKVKRIDEAEYTNRYREQIKANLKPIKAWLERLDTREDQTLLCWEKSGMDETLKRWQETGKWDEERPFCHRNLVIKLVEEFRPDCYGGQDVINYPMPICQQCLTKVIPALVTEGYDDAHYCPKCQAWTQEILYPECA
jgi:hypothetical protein